MFGLLERRKDPATTLRMLMAEKDINTQELADLTGLDRKTISSIRTGRVTKPKSETMYLIADVLGVKPNRIWHDA